jgi:hypothetical protein
MFLRAWWVTILAVLGILLSIPPAAADNEWTAGDVVLVATNDNDADAGSFYGKALFSDYGNLLAGSDSVTGTNSGTEASYDIEVGRTYTKVGSPPNLQISLDLDVYMFTSAIGGFFSSGDGYAEGTAQSNNLGTGVATGFSSASSTGALVEDDTYVYATASGTKSQTFEVKARLYGGTVAHSAGPMGEGHADVQYAHVAYSAP